jgi:hypothetical protein
MALTLDPAPLCAECGRSLTMVDAIPGADWGRVGPRQRLTFVYECPDHGRFFEVLGRPLRPLQGR